MPRIPSNLRLSIPDGAQGTRETLKHMRQLVQEGKKNLAIRDLANSITATVPAKDWDGELCALMDWVRGNIRYALDTNDIEITQGAEGTVQLGYGDCDDFCILLATLCECAGHPCCLVALGFSDAWEFSHVVVIASGAGEENWLCMDATEAYPAGWFPPGATCEMICPVSDTAGDRLARLRTSSLLSGSPDAQHDESGDPRNLELPFGQGGNAMSGSPGYSPTYTTESVTVTAAPSPAYVQSPTFSPSFTSPSFTPAQFQSPSISPVYDSPPPQDYTGQVEAVTVTADAAPQQVQTPTFSPGFFSPTYSPGQFMPPSITPTADSPVEAVTVTAFRPPPPQQVQTPTFDFPPLPTITPNQYWPDFAPVGPAANKSPPPPPQPSPKAPAGAGGGSSSPQPKPPVQPPQKPLVQNFNFPAQQNPLAAKQQPVTPQQIAALNQLTPQQLAALLKNPNLTPAQQQAVQQALQRKLQAAGMSPAQAAAAVKAATPASPLQPAAAMLPLLLLGGVVAAYAVTHRHQIQTQYTAVKRRVRRIMR